MSYYDKAAENFTVALLAFKREKYNAAASRLYYAFYQACVGELTANGKTVADFVSSDRMKELMGRKSDNDSPVWPHDVVVNSALSRNGLNLNRLEKSIIRQSKYLRVKGDYYDKVTVTVDDLEDLFREAPRILVSLGVVMLEKETS